MRWKLLDIRVGRANRQQLWLIILLFFSTNFAAIKIGNAYLKYATLIPSSYILIIGLIRRTRDTGISKKSFFKTILYILILFLFPTTILLGFKLLENVDYTKTIFWVVLSMPIIFIFFGIAFSLLALCITGLLLYPSTMVENEYGPPPQGLNFNTMTLSSVKDKNITKGVTP